MRQGRSDISVSARGQGDWTPRAEEWIDAWAGSRRFAAPDVRTSLVVAKGPGSLRNGRGRHQIC